MSNFTITRLANKQALVSGTDINGTKNQAVLSTARFDEVQRELAILVAQEDFDQSVEKWAKPLMKAADKLEQAMTAVPVDDPASYVQISEASDGEAPSRGMRLDYDADGTILNLIEQRDFDRLVWVGDALFVTEYTG